MSDEGDYDEQEQQFLRDLELAKSLSLASYAEQTCKNISATQSGRSIALVQPFTEPIKESVQGKCIISPGEEAVELRPRPRPSPCLSTKTSSDPLLPPPLNLRKAWATSDLISLDSPSPSNVGNRISEAFEKFNVRLPIYHQDLQQRTQKESKSIFNERPNVLQLQQSHFTPSIDSLNFKLEQLSFNTSSEAASSSSATINAGNQSIPKKEPCWKSKDLIYFDEPSTSSAVSVKDHVLQIFDPLYENSETVYNSPIDAIPTDDTPYDANDPFDYMYIEKKTSERCSSVYESLTLEKRLSVASATYAQPNKSDTLKRKPEKPNSAIINFKIEPSLPGAENHDLQEFVKSISDLRKSFTADDVFTNPGLVISPTIESSYLHATSVKLIVSIPSRSQPVMFTCSGNSSILHILTYLLCEMVADCPSAIKGMDLSSPTLPTSDYILKIWGISEYLALESCLQDYEYVRHCINMDEDIKLILLHIDDVDRKLARSNDDDKTDHKLRIEDLLSGEGMLNVTYDDVILLTETIEHEAEKLLLTMGDAQMTSFTQSVKAICSVLLGLEVADISNAIKELISTYAAVDKEPASLGPSILSEQGPYSIVQLQGQRSVSENYRMKTAVSTVLNAVESFLISFCRSFDCSFKISLPPCDQEVHSVLEVFDTVLARAVAIHRLDQRWSYDNYVIKVQLFHGTSPVSHPVTSKQAQTEKVFFGRLSFDEWMDLSVSYCTLPRESRLVFVLLGRKILTDEQKEKGKFERDWIEEELGWTSVQCFCSKWELRQGQFLLPVWPIAADRLIGPAPPLGCQPPGDYFPVLELYLPEWNTVFKFPEVVPAKIETRDFGLLDLDSQMELMDTVQSCCFSRLPALRREVLWEKRQYLTQEPRALPKVLSSARCWDHESLTEIYGMVESWRSLSPVDAIQLLLPCFPDVEVRCAAVAWLKGISSDELVDLLPQILQALKFETLETSPLIRFLLERSLMSLRVAHTLFWLLVQELPGDTLYVISFSPLETMSSQWHHFRRYRILLQALLALSGNALRECFIAQQLLVKNLSSTATIVKSTKDSARQNTLLKELEPMHYYLLDRPSSLPLSLGHKVCGLDLNGCSYFTSFTVPLKLAFKTPERGGGGISAIFKLGDDLRQDMITLQMVRLMDKIWLREGLDLKMVVFKCIPTGHKAGMIEVVTEAETLRKIQGEAGGLTGPFKDRCIQQWLMKKNPDTLDYQKALYNFTASCAGYSVATYILGICDRHNDNIMICSSGHLFHIDFGKFLGDAQTFGSFKRDRTPFVLSSDMAYVINGGDKPSPRFQQFIDLCCEAFNAVRKHAQLFLNLFALMASSGIRGVTIEAVNYLNGVLMPDVSDGEASSIFAKMIQDALKSWFTPVNFFIHSLGQLRFSDSGEEGALLSFIPKNYSKNVDGKIKNVGVVNYQKRYEPDKYYVYVVRVERFDECEPTYLFRSYEEFCEFQHKLCLMFPLTKLPSLPRGVHLGRSSVKNVAEKRLNDIDRFLKCLMQLAPEISHSPIVYTFFHPILRDQEETSITAHKLKEPKEELLPSRTLRGDIKLSLQYSRGEFQVMVMHVRDLNGVGSQQETPPSSYVKVYLLPDPQKHTKRKTRVVKRNANPTFMEMIVYRLPLPIVQERILQVSVWNYDRVTENEFLGAVNISLMSVDLSIETAQWFRLTNNYRVSRAAF
ncbi:phosphatidylinositol 4-phosphate 3-kinase C2 domain-containing subunit alpha-like [Artemia franciscana]|uniref:phosphatidylinositol 4-phosphate 3-kinase C2 domain-containing subunit alpha-like n=1 Tax=Artemia franciscana TaxID=6661 RepID=UPI0032DAC01B